MWPLLRRRDGLQRLQRVACAIGTSNVKTFLSLILQWSEYTGVKKQESDGHWIPTGESPTQTSDWLEQGQTWGQTASGATFSFCCPPLVVELHTESLVENTDMSSERPTKGQTRTPRWKRRQKQRLLEKTAKNLDTRKHAHRIEDEFCLCKLLWMPQQAGSMVLLSQADT